MTSWSQDDIQKALAIRAEHGYALVTLNSPRDARLFRSAVYNYARRNQVDGFTARVSGCDLILETKANLRRPFAINEPSDNALNSTDTDVAC